MRLRKTRFWSIVAVLTASLACGASHLFAQANDVNQVDGSARAEEPPLPGVPVAVDSWATAVSEKEYYNAAENEYYKPVAQDEYDKPACGCATTKALDKKATAAYKGVFYDNNFDYLCDPCYNDWHLGEHLKRICIGNRLIVDAGGEYRLRYHNETNLRGVPLSSTRPAPGVRNDDFWLQRTRLYLNAEYRDWLRGYAEAIDATSDGHRYQPRAIEINRFDALNLFAEARLLGSSCSDELWVRGGRQELLYGQQRLISPLDWSNTRRTFDGVKMYYKGCNWDIDGFWMRPVRHGQHVPRDTNFDSSNDQEEFIGLWAKYKGRPGTTMEFYFLRLANYAGGDLGPFVPRGDADPNTLGALLKGDWCGLLWEFEGGYQFGNYGNDTIQAGFWTMGLGRKFDSVCSTPTLWLYYDWASGDRNPTDGTHGTFNQYFPLGHKYLGFMDIIGRQNIQDLNLLITATPHEKVKLLLWYHMFWLQQPRDALYNAAGAPIYRDPNGTSGNQVGSELDFLIQWTLTPRINMWFGYSHFWAGDYFQGVIRGPSPPVIGRLAGANGDDADFFYTQLTVRF